MPCQLQQGFDAKSVPVQPEPPVRAREIIRCAKANGERRRTGRRGMRIELEAFGWNIQMPFEFEWPARAPFWQQIPPVKVLDVCRSVNVQILERSGKVRPRRNQAVNADIASVEQTDDVVHG